MLPSPTRAGQGQQVGSIRGVVYDKDFDTPLPGVLVTAVESGQKATTSDQGNFVIAQVAPGRYTLVFSKEGYVRQVKADVVVTAGQLTDVDMSLAGEFTDLDEFVVEDILKFSAGTEGALLKLRFDSPALMDSISAELMSRAGAGDAAAALRLVSGASTQDGKYAVIRGLPDRYVSSQMNGVRLPTADENKRAVELDQFPAAVIESIQVTKTFMPDQQGDASGGAVDLRLKGIPDEGIFQIKGQATYNSQTTGNSKFLTYDGGGIDFWANDDGGRDVQTGNLGSNWDGAVGVSRGEAPVDQKWSMTAGQKHVYEDGTKIGALASVFYESKSRFFDDGQDNSYWVTHPGDPMTPQTNQGTPQDGDFKTALFDVTQGKRTVQWGGLGAFGIASKKHSATLSYLYTRTAEDTATLAEDTRGKAYFFPGYNPDDPIGPGNDPDHIASAPYLRLETLEYTERTTGTLQLHGWDTLPFDDFDVGKVFKCKAPEVDWTIAHSSAGLDQPDKRQFGALWEAPSYHPGIPPFSDSYTTPGIWLPYKPGANFNLGNLQRIWKTIDEDSDQYAVNLKLPFEQWTNDPGFLKVGVFDDRVRRSFNQDTFSNFGDSAASWEGGWEDFWSSVFPFQDHPVTASDADVDYRGKQDISALYAMMDLPLSETWSVIGGARFESTHLGVVNNPESDAVWFPPGATAPVELNPGDADVDFHQDDVLPSIGFEYRPSKQVTFRAAYSQTVARQTFKELTPIVQQEYLGGPIFIGNPDLQMSALKNYDLRADYVPYDGALFSTSWFRKDVDQPIEYVQRLVGFTFTTPVNYPKGNLTGFEFEVRQSIGHIWKSFEGFAVGANATLIQSDVTLPGDEAAGFSQPGILAPMSHRDMTNAPDHLYNVFLTYEVPKTGTDFGLFYTVTGDTLVAGAAESNGNFVPNVYAREYGSLNLSVGQKLGKFVKLQLQGKNLTNPRIEEVYRSEFIGGDVTKTSYTKGIDYSLSITTTVSF